VFAAIARGRDLDRSDAERVDRALAEDSELAQRYKLVREELAETIRAMEKLFAAIDAEEAPAPRTRLRRSSETLELANRLTIRRLSAACCSASLGRAYRAKPPRH